MTARTLHLAFGPVQDFVAQARRTRDLWAGSYLLSYLAAHALAGAHEAGGTPVLPAVAENALFRAVADRRAEPAGTGARVGSVPHVAEIRIERGQVRDVAKAAHNAWKNAWLRVAGKVREHFERTVGRFAPDAVEIWRRQTEGLWTCTWVAGDRAALARRKTLRTFDLEPEPGEKCTVCGAREALRGPQPGRARVREFWGNAAEALTRGRSNEILPNGRERLCAVCTIKRLYPVIKGALCWDVPSWFPSTTTMATIEWRRRVLERGLDPAARDLREAVRGHVAALSQAGVPRVLHPDCRGAGDHTGSDGTGGIARSDAAQHAGPFASLCAAANQWPDHRDAALAFIAYDGDWFYPTEIERKTREGGLGEAEGGGIARALRTLLDTAQKYGIPAPARSYALLAMDGDRLGALLRAYPHQEARISEALHAFSTRVLEIVEAEGTDGRLIYAGGDDVLALLPPGSALDAAEHLRDAYRETFREHLAEAFEGSGPRPTISAGLLYAHVHAPLQSVVAETHRLLDERAKDDAHRDAFAIAIWKRAGIALEFARKWEADGVGSTVGAIKTIVQGIDAGDYSSRFLHRLRDLREITSGLGAEVERAVLIAEYEKGRRHRTDRPARDPVDSASGSTDSTDAAAAAPATATSVAERRIAALQRLWQAPQPSAADPTAVPTPGGQGDTTAPALFAHFLAEALRGKEA